MIRRIARSAGRGLLLIALILAVPAYGARAGGGAGGVGGIQLLVETGDPVIDQAEQRALAILGEDFDGTTHSASPSYYGEPWIRDSYAWGMIPSLRDPSVSAYAGSELTYWLDRQRSFGGWVTAPLSGYYDETPILISAVLDAYNVNGDLATVRAALPKLVRGWRWLARSYINRAAGSSALLYAYVQPHIAADWADQVNRRGYATQLEALWYHATQSLGEMEALVGDTGNARVFLAFATRIKADIRRLLWVRSAPFSYHAPNVGPFGHFRSWSGARDYFELDSNFLCIVYGIADAGEAASITSFVAVHRGYLLGLDGTQGVPARVVYGDYLPADYARKHNFIAPGRYQSASWPSVGALVALGLARAGRQELAREVIARLSAIFVRDGDIAEWYDAAGAAHGAPTFHWAARTFIIALYGAYLGLDLASGDASARPPAGSGSAVAWRRGAPVFVTVRDAIAANGPAMTSARPTRVANVMLCAGCSLTIRWGGYHAPVLESRAY